MAIKVVVGSSPQRSVTTVLEGEKKPLITPDSVTLGIDTVGEYVATLGISGNGLIITPEDANTRNLETSNIILAHANTSSELSTNNDILGFVQNVGIDEFGHVDLLSSLSFDPQNFTNSNGVITANPIQIGDLILQNSDNTAVLSGLTEIGVGDLTIANTTIASPSNLLFDVASNGFITFGGNEVVDLPTPTSNSAPTTKEYVDLEILALETGLLFVGDPIDPNDGANKRYVDAVAEIVSRSKSVKAATTADLGGTFDSGNTTYGATITLDPATQLNIDDVVIWSKGDSLLVKDQTNPLENGTYDILTVGNQFVNWVIQRNIFEDDSNELPGSFEFVTDGTTNRDKGFVATVVDAETFVIDQDDVVYQQFFGGGNLSAGKDLTLIDDREFALNSNVTLESITSLDLEDLVITSNTVTIDSTGGFVIPAGTTDQRTAPQQGMIRYNITDSRFEAYNGNVWTGLGGTVDADQDTFVRAESSSGADNDELEFFTGGTLRLNLANTGNLTFGHAQNKFTVDYDNGNTIIDGSLTINTDTILGAGEVSYFNQLGAIKLPNGATYQRPSPPAPGMIRFNTTDSRFEGYDGSIWSGLAGSVIDVDQDTKIVAESSPNADNDQIQFFTQNANRLTIEANGMITTPGADTDLEIVPSGNLLVGNTIISQVADPVNPQDAVTLNYLENGGFASTLTIIDGANSSNFAILEDPQITLGQGLELKGVDEVANEMELAVANTGVQDGMYGNDGFTPRIRITPDGRIDFATEIPVELQANAIPDFTETSRDIIGLMFTDGFNAGLHNGVVITHNDNADLFEVDLVANTVSRVIAGNDGVLVDNGQTGNNAPTPLATARIYHNDTSTVANTANFGGNFIQNMSFDQYGHVADLATANTDNLYYRLDGAVEGTGVLVAASFADSANTDYYINPFETSRIKNLILGYGEPNSFLEMSDGPLETDKSFIYASGGEIGFVDNTLNYFAKANRTTGDFTITGALIAGGFADTQDTSFVINPAANSNVYNFFVENAMYLKDNVNEMVWDSTSVSSNNGILEFNGTILRNIGAAVLDNDAVTLGYLNAQLLGGEGISLSNTFTVDANVDDSTLTIINDVIQVKDQGITNQQIFEPFIKLTGETNPVIPESFVTANLTLFDGSNWLVNGSLRDETYSAQSEPELTIYIGDTVNFSVSGANTIALYIKTSETAGSGDQASGVTNQGATGGETLTFVPDTVGTFYYIDGADTNRSGVINVLQQYTPDENVYLGETINFVAGEGINTVVSNNTITISAELATEFASNDNRGVAAFVDTDFVVSNGVVELANTGVTAGTYGSASQIPVLEIDEHGLIRVANTSAVAGVDNMQWNTANNTLTTETGDGSSFHTFINTFGANTFFSDNVGITGSLFVGGLVDGRDIALDGAKLDLLEDGLELTLDGKVTGTATSNTGVMTLTTELANTGVVANTYGSSTEIPIITIDEDGRITLANTAAVAGVDSFSYEPANNTITLVTGDGSEFHLQTQTTVTLDGDVTGTATSSNGSVEITTDISTTGVVAGVYGTASQIPVVTVAADGRITSMSNTAVAGVEDFFYSSGNNTLHLETGDGSEFLARIDLFGETIDGDVSFNGDMSVNGDITATGNVSVGETLTVNGTEVLVTNTEILEGIKTVDGAGSSLDADLLDGLHASDILAQAANTATGSIGNGTIDIDTGDGLDGSGTFNLNDFTNTSITFTHSNTSDIANTSLADGNVITGMDFDQFGHVITTSSTDLDGRYYTETELDNGALDSLYFNVTGDTVTGNSVFEENVDIDGNLVVDGTINRDPRITLNGFVNGFTDLVNLANGSMTTSTDTEILVGDGLTGGGSINANVTISHADTSSVANVASVAEKEVLNEISFDEFGHVVAANTKTLDFISQTEADARYVNEDGDVMTGNLEVQAVISQEHSAFFNATLTTTATSSQILFSFDETAYCGGEVVITATRGINRHITKMMIAHNGTTLNATEFATVTTSVEFADYDVLLQSGEGRIYCTPDATTSTEFKVFATLIKA